MIRRFLSSLRFRLLLLVLLALIPSLLLTIYTASEQRRLAAQQAQTDALRMARLAANSHQQLIERSRQLLTVLAQMPAIQAYESAVCDEFLEDLLKHYPEYTQFGVVRRDGTVTCTALPDPKPVNDSDNPYFQRVLASRRFAVGEFRIGRISGKPILAFGYPLLDAYGEIRAVIFAAMDLASLNTLAAQSLMPPGATLTAIDRSGVILARYPEPDKWVGHASTETPITRIVLRQQAEGTAEALGEDGVLRLYAFTSVSSGPEQGIYLIVGIPTSVAYAGLNQILTRDLMALGLVAVLALAAAWVGGDFFLVRRVKQLLAVTQRIAQGDFKARTGINNQVGELNQLAHGFDLMGQALEKRELERNRAEVEIRRQALQAEALVLVASRLNAQLDLPSVLNTLCRETVNALNVSGASVRLWGIGEETPFCAASCSLPHQYCRAAHALTRSFFDERIAQVKPTFAFPDVRALAGLTDRDLRAALEIRAFAGAPMLREGRLIGVLCVYSFREGDVLSEDQLTFLKELAAVGAFAITNARLYAELQQEAHARANLLHQVITAQEDERMRIARELHDETSQSLTAMMMGLDTARLVLHTNPKKVHEQLDTTNAIAKGMLENIHRLIGDLRPSLLDDLGLIPAIHWYGEQRLQPLGIALQLEESGFADRLPRLWKQSSSGLHRKL